MIKHPLTIVVILFFALFITSACHRCVQCTEYDIDEEKVMEWPEICGKKTQIKEQAESFKASVNPNNHIVCDERKTTLF